MTVKPYLALILRVALAWALVSGCNAIKRIDKESDQVLNALNNPGRPASGGSSKRRAPAKSGLSVVEREGMPVYSTPDKHGDPVKVWGQSGSSSKTSGHADTIAALASEMASSGKYEYITMQRAWRTATGRVASSRNIPDLIGVRRDGKVDAFEVKSNSDDEDVLTQRLKEGMDTLPRKRRGDFRVTIPVVKRDQ